ncbi:MAG: type II toxin-antitoxin system HicA family toxin [Planctomycetes bacterium]|nr:type II toxin-antitoxin system HicA family toxin [Planctomycetota bacterium]
MPRLRAFSGTELCSLLSEHGFARARQRGSHVVMQRRENGTRTVPVPMHKEIRIGTLLSIIRQSGLPRVLFEVRS